MRAVNQLDSEDNSIRSTQDDSQAHFSSDDSEEEAKPRAASTETLRVTSHLPETSKLYKGLIKTHTKKKKVLQQTIRRLRAKNASLVQKADKLAQDVNALTQDDLDLLQVVKEADDILSEHPEEFKDVFRNLAAAVVEGKMPLESIETEYLAQLSVNLSQNFGNKFRYTDNFMRFCSALLKLQSGRACLRLLRAKATVAADAVPSGARSAPRVDTMRVNFHFPSENSVNAWDQKNEIDPGFILGISKLTIQNILDTTKGTLRIGCDATDCHEVASFVPGGRFGPGDVGFPGSSYDAKQLEAEYQGLAVPLEKYAANPSLIEKASREEVSTFEAAYRAASDFLTKNLFEMERNKKTIIEKLEALKKEYLRRQTQRALPPGKKSKKKAAVDVTDDTVSISVLPACVCVLVAW